MSSKLDIQKLTYDLGLKPFRFTLSEPSSNPVVLYHSPDGWADAETTYLRHKVYGSVLRNTSTQELTFYKEGRLFLQNCYENSGIDCNATMTVEKLNKTTQTYESYPAAGKFDFSTYQVNEVSVKIQMIDTSFKEKVINRATTEVDILKRVSIEGFEVADFTIDEITMPDTSITLTDTATLSYNILSSGDLVVGISGVTTADFSEMRVPIGSTPDTLDAAFFFSSARQRIVHLTGDVDFDIWGTAINFTIVHLNSTGGLVTEYGIYNPDPYTGHDPKSDSFTFNEYITLSTGDSLIFQVNVTGTRIGVTGELIVNEIYTGTPEITMTAYPYYEAFLRICQLITDTNNPFQSTFLGRTDTPLTTYGSDGDGSLGFVTKGLYFRDTSGYTSDTIPLKFSDLFNSLSSIFRLGMGVDNTNNKVIIEELEYFFNDTVVLDISDQLREADIEKHVMPEMFYKDLEFGYNKSEYLENAGLYEFNTKNSWTTIISSVQNSLKKIVKYRADGQGMRLLLLAPYQVDDDGDIDYDPSKDFKGDSDIFLIDAVRNGAAFDARTDEGFDYIGGSVYAASSFNVWYSPARCLRRWGANVKAGLIKALNSYLRWVSSEKNTTLESRLSTETTTVTENDNICVDDLNANRWLNEKYIVSAPLTTAQLNAFDAAPNQLVKLSDTKYGWVLSLKTKNKDGMAEIELLRCNLDEVTPS